ncbi:unnamed protein product [Effrenium voratum]|nr:unnamed protein product [Effrenium voratum]
MLAAVACCLLRSSWAFIPGREPVRSDAVPRAAVAAAGAVVAASMPQHAEAFVYKGALGIGVGRRDANRALYDALDELPTLPFTSIEPRTRPDKG